MRDLCSHKCRRLWILGHCISQRLQRSRNLGSWIFDWYFIVMHRCMSACQCLRQGLCVSICCGDRHDQACGDDVHTIAVFQLLPNLTEMLGLRQATAVISEADICCAIWMCCGSTLMQMALSDTGMPGVLLIGGRQRQAIGWLCIPGLRNFIESRQKSKLCSTTATLIGPSLLTDGCIRQ